MKTLSFKIKGVAPLLMHWDRLVDPLHPLQKKLAAYTAKTKKTDEDHEMVARLEFEGVLYHDPELGPYIPGQNLERMFYDAATKSKMGAAVKRGLLVTDDKCQLLYDGPRTVEGLYAEPERFVDRRSVKVQRARLMRTRPIFREWALAFSLGFDPRELKSAAEIRGFLERAGQTVGLGDFRPRYGRFVVE